MKAPGSGDKDNWYQGEDKMWYLRNPSPTLRRRSGERTKGRSRSTAFSYGSMSSGLSTSSPIQSPFCSP